MDLIVGRGDREAKVQGMKMDLEGYCTAATFISIFLARTHKTIF